VAEASDETTGLGHLTALKPNLVLLELGLTGPGSNLLAHAIRARSPQTTLIGLTDDLFPASRSMAHDCGVDHCVSLTPMGHTELMAIVDRLQPKPTHH
jgi:DNA-binding NarL/FixJ family response regulator